MNYITQALFVVNLDPKNDGPGMRDAIRHRIPWHHHCRPRKASFQGMGI